MTPDPIALPAGRSLDAIIASRVFHQTWQGGAPIPGYDGRWPWPPPYSTDVAAAWKVVEWLRDRAAHPDISPTGGEGADYPDGWQVTFYDHGKPGWATAWGDTMPVAVCRAALKAAGG